LATAIWTVGRPHLARLGQRVTGLIAIAAELDRIRGSVVSGTDPGMIAARRWLHWLGLRATLGLVEATRLNDRLAEVQGQIDQLVAQSGGRVGPLLRPVLNALVARARYLRRDLYTRMEPLTPDLVRQVLDTDNLRARLGWSDRRTVAKAAVETLRRLDLDFPAESPEFRKPENRGLMQLLDRGRQQLFYHQSSGGNRRDSLRYFASTRCSWSGARSPMTF